MGSGHPGAVAGVDVLVVNENGEAIRDAENENYAVINGVVNENSGVNEIVVLNVCHHDRVNVILSRTEHQNGQANVSPPRAEAHHE